MTNDAIDLPLDDDDRLSEPPLVDSLHYEQDADGFSIIFVPSVGEDPTHMIFVARDSIEGRQVAAYLYRVQQLIGNRLERITHIGGRDYTLRLAGGETLRLSDETWHQLWAPEVFDRLKQIAGAAEAAYGLQHVGH